MGIREYQIGADIMRYVAILNDLADVTSLHMKEINEATGSKYQIPVPRNEKLALGLIAADGTDLAPGLTRDAEVEELKERVLRDFQNAKSYEITVRDFMSSLPSTELAKALAKFDETSEGLLATVDNIGNTIDAVMPKVSKTKSKGELKTLSKDIDSKVPALKLLRRTWCLGV